MSSAARNRPRVERSRTGWDVAFGILSVVVGVIVLAHVAVASLVSVLFIGWMLIVGGIAAIIWAFAAWHEPGHWWGFISGGVAAVLGLGMVRNPSVSLLALTLLAGSLLLVGGVARLVAAFQPGAPRGMLVVNGAITLLLGVLVLFQFPVSALWFVGTMLGVSLVVDGVTTALTGRFRMVGGAAAPAT